MAFIIFAFSAIDFLPNYKINIIPIGSIFAALFTSTVAYTAVKHNLLEINLAIKKSFMYSILLGSTSILYFLFVFLFEKTSQNLFKYQSYAISASAALCIAIIFLPIKRKIELAIDHLFYQGTAPELSKKNELLFQQVAHTERLKSISILASGLAHEIRNPLTAIRTFAEYLPQKLDDKEFLIKFSTIAAKEVSRINELINQMLDFAKPAPLCLRKTDVQQMITETVNFLNSQLIAHKIEVVEDYRAKTSELFADPNQLKQAIFNILLNAIEAMPTGGQLFISTCNPSPQLIAINIQDTGLGIKPQDLPHIFDPFFTAKDSGTGLGLAVTFGILQQHGGKISAASEPNKGTAFRIELPMRDSKT